MAGSQYRSRFGDTTLTKVFVGGLAWETPDEELRRYFEQFGEILEAVIITDKTTGKSKGYGFVTFREAESAARACVEANPVIDGRRANCNIASAGRPRHSPPRGRSQGGSPFHGGPPQAGGGAPPPYGRVPVPQMQLPPPPPPLPIYPPYGYMTYSADYGYPQALYSPHFGGQYHQQQQAYGPASPSTVPSSYTYSPAGYGMQASPRAGFPPAFHAHRMQGQGRLPPPPPPPPPHYLRYPLQPLAQGSDAVSFIPSSSHSYGFQLLPPPASRQSQSAAADSHDCEKPDTIGTSDETTDS